MVNSFVNNVKNQDVKLATQTQVNVQVVKLISIYIIMNVLVTHNLIIHNAFYKTDILLANNANNKRNVKVVIQT